MIYCYAGLLKNCRLKHHDRSSGVCRDLDLVWGPRFKGGFEQRALRLRMDCKHFLVGSILPRLGVDSLSHTECLRGSRTQGQNDEEVSVLRRNDQRLRLAACTSCGRFAAHKTGVYTSKLTVGHCASGKTNDESNREQLKGPPSAQMVVFSTETPEVGTSTFYDPL